MTDVDAGALCAWYASENERLRGEVETLRRQLARTLDDIESGALDDETTDPNAGAWR